MLSGREKGLRGGAVAAMRVWRQCACLFAPLRWTRAAIRRRGSVVYGLFERCLIWSAFAREWSGFLNARLPMVVFTLVRSLLVLTHAMIAGNANMSHFHGCLSCCGRLLEKLSVSMTVSTTSTTDPGMIRRRKAAIHASSNSLRAGLTLLPASESQLLDSPVPSAPALARAQSA